jgi:hypothetical protein
METKWDFAGSTDMWSTSAGGQLDRFYCINPRTIPVIKHLS